MSLIKCKECGHEISSEAAACPHCGAAPKRKRGCLQWFGLIPLACMALAMAAILLVPSQPPGPTTTSGAAPGPAPEPALAVTAEKLFAAYQANEVAADNRYKGKALEVTGTVQSIEKSMFDSILVHLVTPNEFMPVYANMDNSMAEPAASLRKGQKIALLCEGAGAIGNAPQLTDCLIK